MRSRGARGPRARARKTPLAARPSQNPRAALPDRARALESPPLSKANLPGRFFVLRIEDLVLAEDAAARARTLRALEAFLGVPTATNRTIARLGAEFDGYAASYNARNGFRLFSPGEQARHTSAARRARARSATRRIRSGISPPRPPSGRAGAHRRRGARRARTARVRTARRSGRRSEPLARSARCARQNLRGRARARAARYGEFLSLDRPANATPPSAAAAPDRKRRKPPPSKSPFFR